MTIRAEGVVHIVERLAPGGIETLALDLSRIDGPKTRVFSLQGMRTQLGKAWPAVQELSEHVEGFSRQPGLQPRLIGAIASRLRQIGPGAVFVHHTGPLIYGGTAARLAGVPRLIYVEHDSWHYRKPHQQLLAKWCFRILRPTVVAVSQQVAREVAELMPGIRVVVIPPGVPTDRFLPGDKNHARSRLGFETSWKIVGTAGRLVPEKAQHILLRAVSRLPDTLHCAIAGDGPEAENLRALAQELGIEHRTHFLGHREDLWMVYAALHVFCLSSEAEGLPRAVLEAQACGVPVVATDVGGLAEAVCTAVGALVPPGDPVALAEALQRVVWRTENSPSPRAFVEDRLSLAQTSQQYSALA